MTPLGWLGRKTLTQTNTLTCCKESRPCPTVSQYQLDTPVTWNTRHLRTTGPPRFCGKIRKILCKYPLLSGAMDYIQVIQSLIVHTSKGSFFSRCGLYLRSIGLDKNGYQVTFFLFLHKNICCGYSLEAPHRGTSNEYPHIFLWRNKKNINTFGLKKKKTSYQKLCNTSSIHQPRILAMWISSSSGCFTRYLYASTTNKPLFFFPCGTLYWSTWKNTSKEIFQAKYFSIATDKALFSSKKMLISFLFLHKNIGCGYSLEAPHWGASNEYPQPMFSWRNKINIMWIPSLICSYVFSICNIHPQYSDA